MPVQIGANVHSFSNPMGLLSDCHRRIEMFLGVLETVAKTIDEPLNEETTRGLTAALRYFREAAPKHTADEEESLFPRLRGIHNADVQGTLAHLEELENNHRWATAVHAEVDQLGQEYLSTARLSSDEADKFRAAVGDLASMYKDHIRMEDNVIFPAADRVLSQADRASMAREMADRRFGRGAVSWPAVMAKAQR
jgi:hemerythrin-like domain-containing protein